MSFLVTILAFLPALVMSAPEVQLPTGRVQGTDQVSQDTQNPYNAYRGIPFAVPPVNALRFKPPRPFVGTGKDKVISSIGFRPACQQNSPGKNMSEDCLYLNVYTPANASETCKVMVFVYGGSFQTGDASQYIPSELAAYHRLVVVVLQYRLGLYGFLNSQDGDENNGLRDQLLAIKWVKDNIGSFGGDPNTITVFGQSAGAASLSLLAISPRARGLFTQVLLQSGTARCNWAINRNPVVLLDSIAEKLGCKSPAALPRNIRSKLQINCVRNKSVAEIDAVNKQSTAVADTANTDLQALPSIDGDVIPACPESLLANPTYLKENGVLDRVYMVGCNNNEGLILAARLLLQGGGSASEIFFNFTAAQSAEGFIQLGAGLVSPYCPVGHCNLKLLNYQYSQPRDKDGHTSLQNLIDLGSDALFVIPTVQFVRALVEASSLTKVFLYLFDHYPQLLQPGGPFTGSAHGLDLSYEFDRGEAYSLVRYYAQPPQPSEKNLTLLFQSSIALFAIAGSPASSSVNWLPYNRIDEHYFRISLTPKPDQHIYPKRVALWTDIVLKDNTNDCKKCKRRRGY